MSFNHYFNGFSFQRSVVIIVPYCTLFSYFQSVTSHYIQDPEEGYPGCQRLSMRGFRLFGLRPKLLVARGKNTYGTQGRRRKALPSEILIEIYIFPTVKSALLLWF